MREDIEIPEISMNDCVNIGGFSVDPLVRRCIDETPGLPFSVQVILKQGLWFVQNGPSTVFILKSLFR